MATDHRGNPINENNLPKTNKDRMGLSDEQIENPDGTFRELSERDIAEGWVEGTTTYPDGTITYPDGRTVYPEPDDEPDYEEGDTRSQELSDQHWNEDHYMIQRDEDGFPLDHSSLLPSQHQTGRGYGY